MSSATPAVHFLRRHGVAFDEHPYRYEERGGTRVSARELGIDGIGKACRAAVRALSPLEVVVARDGKEVTASVIPSPR